MTHWWVSEQRGRTEVLGASRRAAGPAWPSGGLVLLSFPSQHSSSRPAAPQGSSLAAPRCTVLPPALAAARPSPQPWLWPNWALRAPRIAAFPWREGWGALGGESHCSPLPAAFVWGQPCPAAVLHCLRGVPTPHPSSLSFCNVSIL